MAQSGGQISSLHLAVAAGGGVLLYAALRGVSPLQALRDITSGAPPAVSTEGKVITHWDERTPTDEAWIPEGNGFTDWQGVWKLNKTPAAVRKPLTFVAALNAYASDKYSQEKRWAKGYSDCSSFVGKALLGIGVKPPGGSTTTAYLGSGEWVKVSKPRMGDIAVNSKHMIACLDGATGIGMQNRRVNVRRDTIDNLMANTGPYEIRRYRGWA